MVKIPDGRTECYADARKRWDSETPWRGSDDRPWGKRSHNTKRMRMHDDESISLMYNGHQFITWHPDETITVANFHSAQQQNVFGFLLPASTMYELAIRTGGVMLTCPRDQVRSSNYWWSRFPLYLSKSGKTSDAGQPNWSDRKSNPDVQVFRCERPVRLALDAAQDIWLPVDQDGLKMFEWQELDKSKSRQLNIDYKLTDFDGYLKALSTLNADAIPPWDKELPDEDALLDVIKEGRFEDATRMFPRGDGWNRRYWHWRQNVSPTATPTWSYFGVLRTHLYKREGILVERKEKMLALPEYRRVQSLLHRFS
jgi:hypothetical protein